MSMPSCFGQQLSSGVKEEFAYHSRQAAVDFVGMMSRRTSGTKFSYQLQTGTEFSYKLLPA